PGERERLRAAILGILVTMAQPGLGDMSYYREQPYDPATIVGADRALRMGAHAPAITAIGGDPAQGRNDGLAAGLSAFPCYEPMFGYRLESFPTPLAAGQHLRNPACYIYGGANGCAGGDGFRPEQSDAEAAFAAYRPFRYARPEWQHWADRASVAALGLILLGLAAAWLPRRPAARAPALRG